MTDRLPELLAALADPVRGPAAARALGRTRDPSWVPVLLARYEYASVSRTLWGWSRGRVDLAELARAQALRRAIVDALGTIGAPALAPALERGLHRGDLVQIARRCGDAGLAVALPLLRSGERRRVAEVVRLLRELGDPRAIGGLVPLLDHPAWSLSSLVWRALVRLGRRDHDALAAGVEGRPPWSGLALRAAAGDARVVPALLRACEAGEACGWRSSALRSLGALRARAGVVWMVRGLDDADPAVTEAAIEALGRVGDPAATGPLLRALSRPRHAFAVREALGRLIRSPRPLLAAVAEGLSPERAALALGGLRSIADAAALLEVLAHPAVALREAAVEVAYHVQGRAERRSLVPALEALVLGDPEVRVRRAAGYALGRMNVATAAAALRRAEADVDASVRGAAARGLEMLRVR